MDKTVYKKLEALKTPEIALAYIRKAMESFNTTNDAKIFLAALRTLARSRGGMTELSRVTGINRQNLYRSFSSNGNPKIKALIKILRGFGYHFTIEPIKLDISITQEIDSTIEQILATALEEDGEHEEEQEEAI